MIKNVLYHYLLFLTHEITKLITVRGGVLENISVTSCLNNFLYALQFIYNFLNFLLSWTEFFRAIFRIEMTVCDMI